MTAARSEVTRERLDRLLITSFGSAYAHLIDPNVQEIFVNSDGTVYVDRCDGSREKAGTMSVEDARNFLSTVATMIGDTITINKPYITGVLPLDGSRISGQIPPLVSAPAMCIRKHASHVQPLSYHLDTGSITKEQYQHLDAAIVARDNIVIVGSTGSGKTFFGNSLLSRINELTPEHRILLIEETAELRLNQKCSQGFVVTPDVDMQMLLRLSLRATPDRVVVGEVRGGEAYQLLKMWNTGHKGGICTIHSDVGEFDGLYRLEHMCGESKECTGMDKRWIKEMISKVANIMVCIQKVNGKRKVTAITRVKGLSKSSDYITETL